MVVGLLQPQPETFDLFDDVILLSNGKASRLCRDCLVYIEHTLHQPREACACFDVW